ncbi:Fic family protein [Acidisoma cladoniae]|uniref:Fic family protein n=1 Tax=Acidisoma cladoniae TaxID=3040935 RepID=UPI003313B038
MFDDNWELINGPEAHEIEVLNYSSQVNFIEALIKFVTYHIRLNSALLNSHPSEAELCELHRTGTLLLLKTPGVYRDGEVVVSKGGVTVHQPPHWEDVKDCMNEFTKELGARWTSTPPIEIASFCLWRINWIHPFKNGNGRTARVSISVE